MAIWLSSFYYAKGSMTHLQKMKQTVVDLALFVDVRGGHESVVQNWQRDVFWTNGIKLHTTQHQSIYSTNYMCTQLPLVLPWHWWLVR